MRVFLLTPVALAAMLAVGVIVVAMAGVRLLADYQRLCLGLRKEML